jgi:hypothetical protein
MPISLAFWIIWLLWIIFIAWWAFPMVVPYLLINNLLLIALVTILGWHVFGPPFRR